MTDPIDNGPSSPEPVCALCGRPLAPRRRAPRTVDRIPAHLAEPRRTVVIEDAAGTRSTLHEACWRAQQPRRRRVVNL
jgi:hypothetical protein